MTRKRVRADKVFVGIILISMVIIIEIGMNLGGVDDESFKDIINEKTDRK